MLVFQQSGVVHQFAPVLVQDVLQLLHAAQHLLLSAGEVQRLSRILVSVVGVAATLSIRTVVIFTPQCKVIPGKFRFSGKYPNHLSWNVIECAFVYHYPIFLPKFDLMFFWKFPPLSSDGNDSIGSLEQRLS